MRKILTKVILLLVTVISISGCNKQDEWLDEKVNRSDVMPSTLADFQALLDRTDIMNENVPVLGLVGSDNYYLTTSSWQSADELEQKNAYVWKSDLYEGNTSYTWNSPYKSVFYANSVLEGLDKITRTNINASAWDNAKGSALFYRAFVFYNLLQLYAKPFDETSSATDPGIPLRLTADVNVQAARSSVENCYRQIVSDLEMAIELLPVRAIVTTRPSKLAAYCLLAKLYLNTAQYDSAILYSTKVLDNFSDLINFWTLSPTGTASPFPRFNVGNTEIIYYATMSIGSIIRYPSAIVDSTLYSSYGANDLRKVVFFRKGATTGYSFRGTYTGTIVHFSGCGVNEIYLIRAEANARKGNANLALNDLNNLLKTRWKVDSNGLTTYVDYSGLTIQETLDLILKERRKELPFTSNLRWEDLRRLNKDSRYAITLVRNVNGQQYILPPNDNRYVLPIPDDEIKLNGIEQNVR